MCFAKRPKIPDNKVAPPPPPPEEGAGGQQGAPENPHKKTGQATQRNKLRIDLNPDKTSRSSARDTSSNNKFVNSFGG